MTKERIEKLLKAGANVVLTTKGIDDMALKASFFSFISKLLYPSRATAHLACVVHLYIVLLLLESPILSGMHVFMIMSFDGLYKCIFLLENFLV